MQKFNYMEQRQAAKNPEQEPSIISQAAKTGEQAAKEKLENEKQAKQSEVDSILYQDPREARKSPQMTGSSSSGDNNQAASVKPVPVTIKRVEKEPVVEQTEQIGQSQHIAKTRYNDDVVSDFEEHFDKTDDSDAIPVAPDTIVENVLSVSEPSPVVTPVQSVAQVEPVASVSTSTKKKVVESVEKPVTTSTIINPNAKAHLRNVPSYMALRAREMFPTSSNQDEAVTAYIYYHEGQPDDWPVSDRIKEVLKSYRGDVVTNAEMRDDIAKDLQELKAANKALASDLHTIELGVVYAMFDRMGFRQEVQSSPGTVNFLEAKVADMMKRLETQSLLKQSNDAKRRNRQY